MSISATNGVGKSRTLTHSKVTGTGTVIAVAGVRQRERDAPRWEGGPARRQALRAYPCRQAAAPHPRLIGAGSAPPAHGKAPTRWRCVREAVEVLMFFFSFFLFPRNHQISLNSLPSIWLFGLRTARHGGAKTMAVLRVAWRLLLAAVSSETYAGWCVRLLRVDGGRGPAGDA